MFRKVLAGLGLAGLLLATAVAPAAASNQTFLRHGPRTQQCVGLGFQVRHHLVYETALTAYANPTPENEAALHATTDKMVACGLLNTYLKYFRDNEAAVEAYVRSLVEAWYP